MLRATAIGTALLALLTAAVDAQRRVELPARDAVLRSQPAPVWTVGADEGESWEMLSNVVAMGFDRTDQLFVLDQGNHRVLVFDARGRFVRQFGKQGGGPGEFQAPMGLLVLNDGRVAVLDLGKRAWSVFTATGTHQTDVFIPEELGFPRPGEAYALPDGSIMARSMPALRMTAGGPPDLSAAQKSPVYRLTMTDRPAASTVYEFTLPPPTVRTQSGGGGQRMVMAMVSSTVFEKQPSYAALPDGGVAISTTNDYAIEIRDARGAASRTLTRPLQPRRVTRKDQELAREERRRQMEAGPRGAVFMSSGGGVRSTQASAMPAAQVEEQIRNMTFAEQMPVIERIWSDPTGRLWVQRSSREAGGATPIDLIAPGDRYVGTVSGVRLPSAVSPSGLAAWVERDALDIERIVVRRLPVDWK